MKYLVYLIAVVLLSLVFSSCQDFEPASVPQGPTKLNLTPYMNYFNCNANGEGSEGVVRDVKIRVYRDEYDGNGVVDYNHEVHTFYRTNDMSNTQNWILENNDGFGIPTTIPDDGSYALRISASAQECYSCCFSDACGGTHGLPLYDGTSTEINQNYRPIELVILTSWNQCE